MCRRRSLSAQVPARPALAARQASILQRRTAAVYSAPSERGSMGKRKEISEEKINARLREVTADLRRLRTALQEELRNYRREPRLLTDHAPPPQLSES